MESYPDSYAVLVRRHGVYVWGDDVHKAKTQAERQVTVQTRLSEPSLIKISFDYLFRLAVEMKSLGLPWIS
ncbi:hypothetical protein P7C71_g71, partial [Lecanoromycetidae sp. Uapishka_2]